MYDTRLQDLRKKDVRQAVGQKLELKVLQAVEVCGEGCSPATC